MSTKIHATVDVLGNLTSFALTPGQVHDIDGAVLLLLGLRADTLIGDKGYDATERVIEPLRKAGKNPVIPPRSHCKEQRNFDQNLYKARHLIENFFARLKQYRAIATCYNKTAKNFLSAVYHAASVVWLN